MAVARCHQGKSIFDLRRQLLAVGKSVVHHKDIDELQLQLLEQSLKSGVGLEDVHMHIDGPDSRKRFKRILRTGLCPRVVGSYRRLAHEVDCQDSAQSQKAQKREI